MKECLLFASILMGSFIFSQEKQDSLSLPKNKKPNDSIIAEYREPLSNYITTRVDVNTDVREFDFQNPPPFKDFTVRPNQDFESRITLGYRFLQVALSFAPKIGDLNNPNNGKGDTDIFGIDLGFRFRKIQQKFSYRKVTGYYLVNTNDYREELSNIGDTSKYASFPDFKSTQFGSETYYYFNGYKYSTQLARNQTEIQKKSVGSWVAFLGLFYSDIDGSKQDFKFLNSFLESGFIYPYISVSYYAVVGMGYAYNHKFNKGLYATMQVVPAIGVQYNKLDFPLEKPSETSTDLTIGVLSEFSFGYNTNKWFTGVYTNLGYYTSPTAEYKLSGNQRYAMAFLGYRFAAPKKIEKAFDWVEGLVKTK